VTDDWRVLRCRHGREQRRYKDEAHERGERTHQATFLRKSKHGRLLLETGLIDKILAGCRGASPAAKATKQRTRREKAK
jgi:hypothetical protein